MNKKIPNLFTTGFLMISYLLIILLLNNIIPLIVLAV